MKQNDRLAWVDNAKALGMFLVVWGHTSGIDHDAKELIYAFHVPLFFFLAGTLAKPKYLSMGFVDFFKRNLRLLIVPYIFFWCVSYACWMLNLCLADRASIALIDTWTKPAVGLFYGTGEALELNVTLWFFTALFCTTILFWAVWRIQTRALAAATVALVGLIGPIACWITDYRLPWSIEPAFVAVVFYASGFACQEKLKSVTSWNLVTKLLVTAVLVAMVVLTVRSNGLADMNSMRLGNLALFYVGAFSGIAAVVLLCSVLPGNSIATGVARATIVIFPLHLLAFRVLTGIAVFGFGLDQSFKDESLAWSLFYAIAAMAICVACAIVLRRYLPWTTGYRRRAHAKTRAVFGLNNTCSPKQAFAQP